MSRVTDVCHELVSTDGLEVECSLVVSDVRGTVDSASCTNLVSTKTDQKGKKHIRQCHLRGARSVASQRPTWRQAAKTAAAETGRIVATSEARRKECLCVRKMDCRN